MTCGWMDLLKLSLCLFGSSSSSFFRAIFVSMSCIWVGYLSYLTLPSSAIHHHHHHHVYFSFYSILCYSRTRPDDDDDDEITQSGLNLLRALHIHNVCNGAKSAAVT